MKIEYKSKKRYEIQAPKGWHIVSVGESKQGDMRDGSNGKWIPCNDIYSCGNVAVIIRKNT